MRGHEVERADVVDGDAVWILQREEGRRRRGRSGCEGARRRSRLPAQLQLGSAPPHPLPLPVVAVEHPEVASLRRPLPPRARLHNVVDGLEEAVADLRGGGGRSRGGV